jgi:hypothetical protein
MDLLEVVKILGLAILLGYVAVWLAIWVTPSR